LSRVSRFVLSVVNSDSGVVRMCGRSHLVPFHMIRTIRKFSQRDRLHVKQFSPQSNPVAFSYRKNPPYGMVTGWPA
jgi:hypothetical protein